MTSFDVVVVGAGPSGTTCARECARSGLKTLILEKERLPRYKPCGGAISGQTQRLLDFKLKEDLVEREIRGIRAYFNDAVMEVRKQRPYAVLTMRDKFDRYLAGKAVESGSKLSDDERVEHVEVKDSHVELKTNKGVYRASVVVGGDGVTSAIAKYVRPNFRANELALAIESEIPSKIPGDIDAVDIHFGLTYWGYGWVFPKREHYSVGFGGLLSELRNPRGIQKQFLKTLGYNTKTEYVPHMIPAGGFRRKTIADRIILVGDAAGYVDPFTGEGMAYAVHSGKIAGETIVGLYDENDFTERALKKYDVECYRAFGEDLEYALKFSRKIYGRLDFFLKILFDNPELLEKFLDVSAGELTYKGLYRWLLPRAPKYASKTTLNRILNR